MFPVISPLKWLFWFSPLAVVWCLEGGQILLALFWLVVAALFYPCQFRRIKEKFNAKKNPAV